MRTKYHLSKYYQSELSFLHEEGGAFYKPLFFEFPNDPRSYNDQHLNVMLGAGLKLAVQTMPLDRIKLNSTSRQELGVMYSTHKTAALNHQLDN